MKAKAWLFTLLICMISFAGFGMTTPDLAENSTAEVTLAETPVSVVAAIADFDAEWLLIEVKSHYDFGDAYELSNATSVAPIVDAETAGNYSNYLNGDMTVTDPEPNLQIRKEGNQESSNTIRTHLGQPCATNVATSGGRLSLFYTRANDYFRKPDFT